MTYEVGLCVFGFQSWRWPGLRGCGPRPWEWNWPNGGLTTVFGGTDVGLMSVLARAALDRGGQVVGVIPRILAERKMFSDRLTELHVVESLHERKQVMEGMADGFIALPGGLGTLDETI